MLLSRAFAKAGGRGQDLLRILRTFRFVSFCGFFRFWVLSKANVASLPPPPTYGGKERSAVQDQEKGLLVFVVVVSGEEVQAEEGDLGGQESGVEHSRSHMEDGCEIAPVDGAECLPGGPEWRR